MNSEHKIQQFLTELENLTNTSEVAISDKISEFIKSEFPTTTPDALKWELIAFNLSPSRDQSNWGTYYGPFMVWKGKDGKKYETPSLTSITSDVIDYWEERAVQAKNPIMKARYADLVWEFTPLVKKVKPHYSMAQVVIDAVISIAKKNLHPFRTDTHILLKRAIPLALTINDLERLSTLKKTVIDYEKCTAEDDKPGTWAFAYEILIKNRKIQLSEREESEIIKALEERYQRLLTKNDIWALQQCVTLLCDYYRLKNPEKVRELIHPYANLVKQTAMQASALIGIRWLEDLRKLYLQYGLPEDAKNILHDIKTLNARAYSELKRIEFPVEIPKKELEDFIESFFWENNLQVTFTKIAMNFTPQKDRIEKQLKDLESQAPLLFLISKQIMDHDGRSVATIGVLREDIEGNIVNQIRQNLQFETPFLQLVIDKSRVKFNITPQDVVEFLYLSPVFDEHQKDILSRGIEFYLNGDYDSALHLLVPQIEAGIRNLAEKIGIPTLKPNRVGGYFYKTLDELLREEGINLALTEDVCIYLRTVLTDPRGLNIRNNICHGISNPKEFNRIIADRIFQVLLLLGCVRESAKQKE